MSQAILFHERDLNVPAIVSAGSPKNTQGMRVTGIVAEGNFPATWSCQLQGSAGTLREGAPTPVWTNIGSAITAATVLESSTVPLLLPAWSLMRINVTSTDGDLDVPDIFMLGDKRDYG